MVDDDKQARVLNVEDDEDIAAESPPPPTQEELEKLAVFRDFVAGLDLDDLGKPEA